MASRRFPRGDLNSLPSPCFFVDLGYLEDNLKILQSVKDRTGAKILLALKGFSMVSTFDLVRKYLDGTCASSLHEARLGKDAFQKEVQIFSPAYQEKEWDEILQYVDKFSFNSFSQWQKYRSHVGEKECAIRINPEHSEVEVALYDPCSPTSRLGVRKKDFEESHLEGITGLHFHSMCEQNSDTLERTLEKVEKNFDSILHKMKWVNFGGGHHITRDDYDLDLLVRLINDFQKKYDVQVYLEPGEAVALNAGFLVTTVVDIVKNEKEIAILDTSAETHMPDVLAMPYRPEVIGAGKEGEKKHSYQFAGMTCLAGDVIGDYSFDEPLQIGQRIVFCDMAIYSMVKTTTFNGINLPSYALYNPSKGQTKIVKEFGYQDFLSRL